MTRSRFIRLADLRRRNMFDTAFRGGLSVVLYLIFPAFSDIYRLWERASGSPGWTQIPFEYPPISAFYFEPLTLLPSSRWAVAVNGIVMVAAAVVITWVLGRYEFERTRPDVGLWIASPALLLFLPINWDVLVALVCVAGVLALYRDRAALAGFWSGLGTAFKIFPGAVVLPVIPLIDGWRKRIIYLVLGLAALVGSYLLYFVVEPDDWLFHLDFAAERGDSRSTVWGVLDSLFGVFGGSFPEGAVNLSSIAALVVSLLLITWWAARARPGFAEVAAISIIALLTFNKVFKPQYILWVLPFLAWIGVDRLKTRIAEWATLSQFAVIYVAALPAFIYPIQAAVRVVALAWIAVEIVRRRSMQALESS